MSTFPHIVAGRVIEPLIEIENGLDFGMFFDLKVSTLVPVTQSGVTGGWTTADGGKTPAFGTRGW